MVFCFQSSEDTYPFVASFDGNFGLVRKRSSGKSLQPPKHGNRVFLEDDLVSEFVSGCDAAGKADDVVGLILCIFLLV